MSWRTVIIESQSKLDYKMGYMVVRGLETRRVLLDEVAVLALENPAVSLTGCLVEALIEKKIKVIFCDSKRNPAAELIPYHGSHDSSAKIRTQISWSEDVKSMIWQEIIAEKIRNQSAFLSETGHSSEAELLMSYINQIQYYDSTNREGHAAKVYFNALFGMSFTRGSDCPVNSALNYGYSMILSAFTREISYNGYLTQLGLFHNNMFNHFNLASDIMEPYRILVDRFVYNMNPKEFDSEEKHYMWNLLEQYVIVDGKKQTVKNAVRIYTRSIFEAVNDMDVSRILFFETYDQ